MKLTEAYIVKLIKKYIRQFMCCCVGSTIGEGEPEGLVGTPGQMYFDTLNDIIYVYDGTSWTPTNSGGGGGGSVNSVNGDIGPNVVLNQDEVLDGATYKQYSQTEKTKLAGIATGATANDTDANLRDRTTHTGVQAQSTITGLVSDLALKAPLASPSLTGTPVAPTATAGTNTTQISTTAFVQAAIAALVDSSPSTLNTLNELAAALGDDPNFATTMTTALGNKVDNSDVLNALTQTVSGTVLDARQGKILNDLITALSGTVSTHTSNTSNPHSVTKAQVGLSAVPNTDFTTPIAASTSHIANTSNPHSVTKTQVGLGSVDNTADTAKPVSTAQQTALNLKANIANPTFTGTVGGITKAMVGLTSVDDTSDAAKPVSTAQQTALNLKSNIANPTFTGLVTTPLIKITSGSPALGKVLTSDADGDASWETPASGVTDHALLSNIGTNTHAQIDTHLANTSNPHSVTKSQVGLSNVPNTDFTAAVAANTAKTTNATHTGEVTGSGALTITNGAVTLAKMADIATSSLIYRKTAGTGVPEVNTLATLKTDLGLTGTNSGDQTSIAGITGTKAQFDTAVTDGNIMYIGDAPTSHTHTASQITDFSAATAATASVTANTAKVTNATHTGDVTGATALTIANNAVTNAKMAQVSTSTIKGRITASTGDVEDLTATQVRTLINVADGATAAETTTTIGALINGATDKPTPIDADFVGLMDSAASNILKKLSWANIKATLKTYFDTLYVALTGAQTIAGVKTFSSSPIVPDPTTAQQVSSKKYVDDSLAGLVPTSRTLSVNGISQDLSVNRSLGSYVAANNNVAMYSQSEVAIDINDHSKTQAVYSTSANTNNPSAASYHMWVNGNSVNYTSQIGIIDNNTDGMYFRTKNAGTWGSWFQLASRVWVTAQSYITSSSSDTLSNKTLTSPLIQTSPTFVAGTHLKKTIPTADTTATGNTTNEFQTSYTTVLGDLVYLNTSGQWALVDANVSTGYDCLLGIVLQGSITSGNVVNVALPGTFIYMASAFPTFTIGKPIYMSETAGAVTQTQPVTADAAIRVIGYAVHADKMFFNPTGVDYITHV